ncbi:hypothetical protein L3Q82_012026 [Scortum barcoo]|uniref:Uncharacterized protein n=1 Tax=Scortum barcoo TaxID=214431 RepID=A0ACB8W6Q0_9TELE|nr:hypothetical protein L3Q82_012026 [Scortum barcoo]
MFSTRRKTITVRILDREEYNKQSSFYLLLDQPLWRRNGKERTGGLGRRGPRPQLLPKPHCTGPSWTFLRVVSLLEGGPTSPFRAEPGRVPWAKTQPPGARLRAPTPGLAPGWGSEEPQEQREAEESSLQPMNLKEQPKEEEEEEEPLAGKDEEERRIAEMGRPMLGDHVKLEIIIEESYEFKNTVDKLIKKTNLALLVGTNSWRDQFIEAITVSAGEDDDDEECGEEKLPSCFDYVMHFLTVFWKVLFAFVPPAHGVLERLGLLRRLHLHDRTAHRRHRTSQYGGSGLPLWLHSGPERLGHSSSICCVGNLCARELRDTFASKVAAIQDQYADASIGNVTGSNAVNVFLGIGVAWSIAAIYHNSKGQEFKVDPGTLAFSVTLFTIFAFISVATLMYRRRPEIGGELGGPRTAKVLTTMLFISLWLLYILFSSLEAYCHIQGF